MDYIIQQAKIFYSHYQSHNTSGLIPIWQWLFTQDSSVMEQFFFELRLLWEEDNQSRQENRMAFEKEFMDNIYQLIEYQKIEAAKHTRILEMNQKVRTAFKEGFRGESKHLSAEQQIVHGKMMGENKSFRQRLIDTINDQDFSEEQQKRVAELLNEFAIEQRKKERGILQKLRDRD